MPMPCLRRRAKYSPNVRQVGLTAVMLLSDVVGFDDGVVERRDGCRLRR